MPTYGFGVLKSLVDHSVPFSMLAAEGVDESCFLQGREQRAYAFVRDYISRFGTLPQLSTIGAEIGDNDCFAGLPDEPVEYWIEQVKARRRSEILRHGLQRIDGLMEGSNISEAVNAWSEVNSTLLSSFDSHHLISFREGQLSVLQRHEEVQQRSVLPGVTFGLPYIDAVSGGAQPGDAIVIAGEEGVGKTFLSLKMSVSAYESGRSVLYLSTEAPPLQMFRRIVAMRTGTNVSHWKLGRLSDFGVARARGVIDVEHDGDHFFQLLPAGLYAKVDDVVTITRELGPDILVVDGAYLLRVPEVRGQARWERQLDIVERLKQLSIRENIPVIGTYQFNRRAPGMLHGLAGTSAIGQIASIVFSFEYERREDATSSNPIQYRMLKLLKGRDGERGVVRILFNMIRTNISQDRVVSGTRGAEEDDVRDVELDEELTAEL